MKWRTVVIVLAFYIVISSFMIEQGLMASPVNKTIRSSGAISTGGDPYIGDSYIGQYSNGTYYAVRQNHTTTSADPTALINNEMVYGGYIYIEPGSYQLTGPIVPQSNVYLKVSLGATIYQPTPANLGASISLMLTTTSVQSFTLDGGGWNGNKGSLSDHRDTGTWAANYFKYLGIAFFGGNDRLTVKNVILKNVIGQGIYFSHVTNGYIYNCTVINAGDNPISVDAGDRSFMSNTMIEKCYVSGGQDVGINTFHASNVTIRDCIVKDVLQWQYASHWGIGSEESDYVNMIGNNVSNCDYDMVMTISNNINVIGNTLSGVNGLLDANMQSSNVYVAYNDFSALTNIKVDLVHSVNVTYYMNIGYP